MKKNSKKWSERFSEPTSEIVKRFTASVTFDQRLAMVDIEGSLAHAEMLKKQKIISASDFKSIAKGLNQIQKEIQSGKFKWSIDLEDVHLNIEKRLTDIVGEPGKKLHTGRSRNDQVATDMRLWLREVVDKTIAQIETLQRATLTLAGEHVMTIMPGLTHLQIAQPISFAHHLLAYFEMLERDKARFQDSYKRINTLPLGAAALAGTSYPIDRAYVAKLLKFDSVMANSIDAVSDRDFLIEFNFSASLLMTHLSRWSEELIMWSSPFFGFIEISDGFCTGSSIMPQKKNPDVPELVRGKVARVNGHLVALLTLMKGQPLAYNKDNQEDKEPIFDVADTISDTLNIYAEMVAGITVSKESMEAAAFKGYSTATDLADYLVKKGMPFREAHGVVAKAVKYAIAQGCDLSELELKALQKFSPLIEQSIFQCLTLKGSVQSRNHFGGTSFTSVKSALKKAHQKLA
ncbi:MAG: argininosuccinate lyase [Methylophilales bacterium]|jgi:argininosuccinate lyase|nr:argininosuccinate lyase [Methylophilales bacterium]|tara:strand:- start:1573 stop:2955 length:1383 start_codon:yes stop_codon:yes gene_type:complete